MTLIINDLDWALGNYECDIDIFDKTFLSVDHAFLFTRLVKEEDKQQVAHLSSEELRDFGRSHETASFSEEEQAELMSLIQEAKFNSNIELAQKLIDTGDEELIFQSRTGFWGIDHNDEGDNVLGLILEDVRKKLNTIDKFFYTESTTHTEESFDLCDVLQSTLDEEGVDPYLADELVTLVSYVEDGVNEFDDSFIQSLSKEELVIQLIYSRQKFIEVLRNIKDNL
jgi:predicted NAD-dependent protein-ADP-ribosyltransferase YbiA (DUF1768 family)